MTANPVSVSTGQPLTPWVASKGARLAIFTLYCEDNTNAPNLIPEGAAELDVNGNAVKSELVEPNVDLSCGPGTGAQRTYILRNCPYNFVRLSASGPAPAFPATDVRGSVEVVP